ncbi:ATP-binding protein [Serinicoccus chungangensis]|uniref:ATP-binding protein n=1 Tax=Serinicoccus chungangensis TaxID=767452 RepID=UPI001EE7B4A2|nr:ATP-binding protein [Serinicoccus chungangensis]
MPEVPLGLVARKLNRHTFWCGQSGSGKTYALGVLLRHRPCGERRYGPATSRRGRSRLPSSRSTPTTSSSCR